MKIGILSDIHGNNHALEKVLCEARKLNIDKLFVTGDFVGYYYNPEKVIELLSSWDYFAVKGNHEIILEKSSIDNFFLESTTKKYGHGIKQALAKLSTEQLKFFKDLPLTQTIVLDNISFSLFHGSPRSEDEYLYPDAKVSTIEEHFGKHESDVFIGGHTHYSAVFSLGHKIIINPGSVGQSRTNGGLAFWGIYNTENRSYSQRVTPYNTDPLQIEIDLYDKNHEYLSSIIKR